MKIKVGINGFGRIGRQVMRIGYDRDTIEFVGVNDIVGPDQLAHLLKYDSVHGKWAREVSYEGKDLVIDGEKIPTFSIKDPKELPWGELGADIIVEATGLFKDRDSANQHIEAGAKKVLISAPAKNPDGTFLMGVNADQYDKDKHDIISIGSCTTNCFAPVVKVLNDNFGLEKGLMTTTHAYTVSQNILDGPHKKDMRRARACAVSMVPTTTGAAKAINLVLPEMEGKLDALAVRVPTPDGSLVDLTAILQKEVTRGDIDSAMKTAAEGAMKGVLEYCTDPIVSIDVVGNPHSSIYDSELTKVLGGNLVKIFSWYDNEAGFSHRMVDTLEFML